MRYDQRPEPGAVVYLTAASRRAGRLAYSGAAVQVVHYDQWPYVQIAELIDVSTPGRPQVVPGQHHSVHCDSLRLHPPKHDNTGGDQAHAEDRKPSKPMPGKPTPLALGPGEEEMTLW